MNANLQEPVACAAAKPLHRSAGSTAPAPPRPTDVSAPIAVHALIPDDVAESITDASPAPQQSTTASGSVSFSVTSWNTLSMDYINPSAQGHLAAEHLAWAHRGPAILAHLAGQRSSIECMQEVDVDAVDRGEFDSLSGPADAAAAPFSVPADGTDAIPLLSSTPRLGSIYLKRPHSKRDGCLVRWNADEFELMPMVDMQPIDRAHLKAKERAMVPISEYCVHCPEHRESTLTPRKAQKERPSAVAQSAATASSASDATVNAATIAVDDRTAAVAVASAGATVAPSSAVHSAPPPRLKRSSRILECCHRSVSRHAKPHLRRAASTSPHAHHSHAHAHTHTHNNTNGEAIPAAVKQAEHGDEMRAVGDRATDEADAAHAAGVPFAAAAFLIPAAPVYFHPIHLNDLSLLTHRRSNRARTSASSGNATRYRRENVGMLLLLRHRASGRMVLLCTTHLFWNPSFEDVKLHQTVYIMQCLQEMHARLT
ncbi:MAG: hypothetical protein O7C59_03710, partial [Rickettsia endosymbiont of Ixodes persulcatus]|nr:hypothetical protein [Rickettsia endosymbiont of Ixodes persulcatus]